MIKSISFSKLSNNLLYTFIKRMLAMFSSFKATDSIQKVYIDKVKEFFDHFALAFENDRSTPYTEIKAQKDSERDDAFIAFRSYIEACSYRKKDGWNDMAGDILAVIRKHGWSLWNLGYKAQTASASALYSEIRNSYMDQINSLMAEEWLKEAEDSQQTFEQVHKESIDNTNDGPTVTSTRPALEKSVRSLLQITAMVADTNPSESDNNLINNINELIIETMTVAKAANTRDKNTVATEKTDSE